MLVLTRKAGESLVLVLPNGERIEVEVKQARAQVKLGIDAPGNVKILRHEMTFESPVSNDADADGTLYQKLERDICELKSRVAEQGSEIARLKSKLM